MEVAHLLFKNSRLVSRNRSFQLGASCEDQSLVFPPKITAPSATILLRDWILFMQAYSISNPPKPAVKLQQNYVSIIFSLNFSLPNNERDLHTRKPFTRSGICSNRITRIRLEESSATLHSDDNLRVDVLETRNTSIFRVKYEK